MSGATDIGSIEKISLADIDAPKRTLSTAGRAIESSAGKSLPQINLGALIVLDAGLKTQSREDTSNSVLFSQLAADKQFGRKSAPDDWLNVFLQTMSTLGWIESSVSQKTSTDALPIDWTQPIEAPLKSNALQLGQFGVAACRKLLAASDALKLWNATTADIDGGTFILAPAELKNGSPALSLSMIGFVSSSGSNHFLDFSRTYQVGSSFSYRELNEDVYSKIRAMVIQKLGDRPEYMVFDVPATGGDESDE